MSPRSPIRLVPILLLIVMAGAVARSPERAAAPDFDAARVGWSEVRMTASLLFLTAEASLALRIVPGSSVVPDLLPLPPGVMTPLVPGAEVLELRYEASGAGRKSRLTLLMDPVSGAALQNTVQDLEGNLRLRTFRFGTEGAFQSTRSPADEGENALLPARWTGTSEGLRAYPIAPGPQAVIESTGLLYAIAAASLNKPGDTLELLVFRRRDTQLVHIEVLPAVEIGVHYDELWPKGAVQRSGRVLPIRLTLQGLPVPGSSADDEDLEVLGLRGKLELLLDPVTRAPLELSGNIRVLGVVTLRLAAVRLR